MGKAIEYIQLPPKAEEKLAADTLESQEALSEALELLRELHERGGLELALKLLRGGSELTAGALEKLNDPAVVRGLRSLITLAEALGSVDPDELRLVTGALGSAVHGAAHSIKQGERTSLAGAARGLTDPDVQLGLSVGLGLLGGLGRGVRAMNEIQGHED